MCAGGSAARGQSEASSSDQDLNLRAYVELLRSDIKTQKIAVVGQVMQLTDEDGNKFWPIYRQYETELSLLTDEKLKLIRDYTSGYDSITDEKAHSLAVRAFELEAKRTALKRKYYDKLGKALSPRMAARFFQVENQILMLLDLQVASLLPVVKAQ